MTPDEDLKRVEDDAKKTHENTEQIRKQAVDEHHQTAKLEEKQAAEQK